MEHFRSDDAELVFEDVGNGPPVVLLHPFPVNRDFWKLIEAMLSSRYRLIVPDLRGHGDSGVGEGPATMAKHARDLQRLLDTVGAGKATFVGVSIGGYILFEFWRHARERVTALALCNTKAQADTEEAKANRLKVAAHVLEQGTEPFIEGMLGKLLGKTTISTRPDLLEGARRMMRKMSAEDVSLVQRGMAERPDSVGDLKTIAVPTLIVIGQEDTVATAADGELMRQHISGSRMKVVPKAGHYSPWEQPEAAGGLLRQFLDSVHKA